MDSIRRRRSAWKVAWVIGGAFYEVFCLGNMEVESERGEKDQKISFLL